MNLLEELHKESFVEQLNTKFQLIHEGAPLLELELIEVTGPGIAGRQERFYLVFRGPLEMSFDQGMGRVEHEQLGAFDLFLVAIAREPDGMRYEAVFNRFVE